MLVSFCLSALAPWGAPCVVSQAGSITASSAQGRALSREGNHATSALEGLDFVSVGSFWGMIGWHGKLTFL